MPTPSGVGFFNTIYIAGEPVRVRSARPSKNIVILKLDGTDTPEDAQKLVNRIISINRADAKLPKGTYFIADLIGLQVVDADNPEIVYGELTDVSQTGANDVYHVRFADGKERYVPAIPQVIIQTDLQAGIMRIRPLDGLFED